MKTNLSENFQRENDSFLMPNKQGLHIVETLTYDTIAISELDPFVESEDLLEAEPSLDDEMEIDLSSEEKDRGDDPVRVYLCDMAVVPLLTREEEISVARRI